jgi:hypothetical protein
MCPAATATIDVRNALLLIPIVLLLIAAHRLPPADS